MLDLRRDLFARLVISSHKDKELNESFRVIHVGKSSVLPIAGREIGFGEGSGVSRESSDIPVKRSAIPISVLAVANIQEEGSEIEKAVSDVTMQQQAVQTFVKKSPAAEKIDEKVEKIVEDPKLSEIKTELEFAEMLLMKIKSLDSKNNKIPIIEVTISKLRAMLDQKMYV